MRLVSVRDGDAQQRRLRATGPSHGSERDAEAARLYSTFDQAPVGLAQLSLDGRWLRVNQRGCALLGRREEDLLGHTWRDLTHPEDLERGESAVCDLLSGVKHQATLEKCYVREDGSAVWAGITARLVRMQTGAPDYVIVALEDVSDRKLAESAHGASETHLQALHAVTEAILDQRGLEELLQRVLERIHGVLAVDTATILLVCEDGQHLRVRASVGLEAEVAREVRVPVGAGIAGTIAATRQPLFVPDPSRVEVVSAYLRERIRSLLGVPLLVDERLLGVLHVGSATPRQFGEDDLHLLRIAADRLALAIEHVQLLASEQEARAAAESAVRLRDDILSLAAHDLRAPLTNVRGRAQLIDHRLEGAVAPTPHWLQT
jgi:PAS domain S-box-containing protein